MDLKVPNVHFSIILKHFNLQRDDNLPSYKEQNGWSQLVHVHVYETKN